MKMKNWKKMVAMTMTAAVLSSGSLMMEMPKAEAGMDWGKIAGEVFGAAVEIGKSKNSSSSKPTADQLATLGYQKHAHKNMTNEEKLFMLAVKKGDVQTAKQMIDAGVDINGVYDNNFSGHTALFVALENFDRNMQQMLLENGADVTGFYRYDNVFCAYLVYLSKRSTPYIEKECYETFQYLHNWGAPINVTGSGYEYGYDCKFVDNAITLLDVHHPNKGILYYAINEGINLDHRRSDGFTPYLAAVYYGNIEVANLLAANGADIYALDNERNNAESLALSRNNLEMYKTVKAINARGQQPSHKK